MEYLLYKKSKLDNPPKKRSSIRKTGFKGVHVHYFKDRDKVYFRPTLKINGNEIMGYQTFEFDYFGLFIAIRYYDNTLKTFLEENPVCNYIVDGKDAYPLLISDQKINTQIKIAIEQSDLFSLQILYKTLTGKKEFPFEEVAQEILK